MKTRIVSLFAVASVAGLAAAQSIQVGPGAPTNLGSDPFSHRDVLWDNGDTDGTNGYSTWLDLGRYIYDDFSLSSSAVLQDFHLLHIWNSFPPGSGTGLALDFYADAGGAPGAHIATASISNYSEVATGRNWFGRQEARISVDFADIALGAGNYWVSYSVDGPENGFSMIRSTVTGSELWWRADDLGIFGPGSSSFGVAADGAWVLTGIPAPGALALLGLGGLAASRRRR